MRKFLFTIATLALLADPVMAMPIDPHPLRPRYQRDSSLLPPMAITGVGPPHGAAGVSAWLLWWGLRLSACVLWRRLRVWASLLSAGLRPLPSRRSPHSTAGLSPSLLTIVTCSGEQSLRTRAFLTKFSTYETAARVTLGAQLVLRLRYWFRLRGQKFWSIWVFCTLSRMCGPRPVRRFSKPHRALRTYMRGCRSERPFGP